MEEEDQSHRRRSRSVETEDEDDRIPQTKKARIGESHQEGQHEEQQEDRSTLAPSAFDTKTSHYQTELARLQNQVKELEKEKKDRAKLQNQLKESQIREKELKQIACKALSGNIDYGEDVPEHWKNDVDIAVAASVAALRRQRGGVYWWDLSQDMDVLFDTRVTSVLFELSEIAENKNLFFPTDLSPSNRGDVLVAALYYYYGRYYYGRRRDKFPWDQEKWSSLVRNLAKENANLALYLIRSGRIDSDDCPCLLNAALMKTWIEQFAYSEWSRLPTTFRTDLDFARSFEVLPRLDVASQLLQQFPALRGERSFWQRAVNSRKLKGGISDLVRKFAPVETRSDRELMLEACAGDSATLRLVDQSLASDRDFLFKCVDRNGHCLFKIPQDVQLRFPDVVDQALLRYAPEYSGSSHRYLVSVANHISQKFWDDRAFVLRWFKLGLPFVRRSDKFQEAWKSDEEMFLTIAKKCPRSFKRASMVLRNNKGFMLSILEINPLLMTVVGPKLKRDFDLLLIVFSIHKNAVEWLLHRHPPERLQNPYARINAAEIFDSEQGFLSQVEAELADHDAFCSILPVATLPVAASDCPVALLDKETVKMVATFVGVPTGTRLRRLRQARSNLAALLSEHSSFLGNHFTDQLRPDFNEYYQYDTDATDRTR